MILKEETTKKFNYDPDIRKNNTLKVCIVKCDFCNKIFERELYYVFRDRKNVELDACTNKQCRKEKRVQIYLKKYGVRSTLQLPEVIEKRKQTCLKKYGVENVAKVKSVQDKKAKNCIEKYGVRSTNQLNSVKEKKKEACLKKYGVINPGLLDKFSFAEILEFCKYKKYKPCFTELEYKNYKQKLFYKCLIHDVTFDTSLENLCRKDVLQCNLCKSASSGAEREVSTFLDLNSIKHECNNREHIHPKELDIFIPDKNLAIEFHGLYWHSELKVNKKYHYDKFKSCNERGIALVQIFEDEWRDKKDIWKSIIRNKLGIIKEKYNARNCTVQQSKNKEEIKNFLNNNHLQGYCNFINEFELRDKYDNLLMVLTLRKPFINKNKENIIEIARLCTKNDIVIRGGFQKILKYVKIWAKENGFNKLVTYSDCRLGIGNVYKVSDMEFLGHTGIGYDYTDYTDRFGRFKYRAKNGKTEREIVESLGLYRIYNAGNYKWEIDIK